MQVGLFQLPRRRHGGGLRVRDGGAARVDGLRERVALSARRRLPRSAGHGGARVEVHRPRGQREPRVRGRAAGMAAGHERGLRRVGGPDIRGADAQSRRSCFARLGGAANRARLFGDQRRLRSAIYGALCRARAQFAPAAKGGGTGTATAEPAAESDPAAAPEPAAGQESARSRRAPLRKRRRVAYGSRVIGVQGQNTGSRIAEGGALARALGPGMEDQTVYQTLRATREGAMFAFAPISVKTPEGSRRRPGHRLVRDSGRRSVATSHLPD